MLSIVCTKHGAEISVRVNVLGISIMLKKVSSSDFNGDVALTFVSSVIQIVIAGRQRKCIYILQNIGITT